MSSVFFIVVCTAFSVSFADQNVQLETSFEVAEGLKTKSDLHDISKENGVKTAVYFLPDQQARHLKTRTPYEPITLGGKLENLANAMLFGDEFCIDYVTVGGNGPNKPTVTCTYESELVCTFTKTNCCPAEYLTSCYDQRTMDNSMKKLTLLPKQHAIIIPTKVAAVTTVASTTELQIG